MTVGTDLTKGSVAKTLVRFTVPFLLSNVLHTLYSLVDMRIVGRYADATQISAVSIGAAVMMLVNGLIMGLGTGSTVLVGQAIGSRREKDEKETISTVFAVFPLFALLLLAIGQILVPTLLRMLNTPPEAWDGAIAYLRICFIGLIFTGFFLHLRRPFVRAHAAHGRGGRGPCDLGLPGPERADRLSLPATPQFPL